MTPPPPVAGVINELIALPRTAAPTREQLDRLAAGYADAQAYAERAWRLCGTPRAVAPAAP